MPSDDLDQPEHRQSLISFRHPRAESLGPQPKHYTQGERFRCASIHNFDHLSHIYVYVRIASLLVSSRYGSNHPLHPHCLLNAFLRTYLSSACATSATRQKWLRCVMIKPVFRVADQVRHNTGCTTTENDYRLEMSDLGGIAPSM